MEESRVSRLTTWPVVFPRAKKRIIGTPAHKEDKLKLGKRHSLGRFLVLTTLAVLLIPQILFAQAVTTTSVFVLGEPENTVEGASSTLVRTPDGITFTILTSGLTANDALTIWLVIFNNPELCSAPGCGGDDLAPRGGDPAIDSSVVWGNTGTVVTADGKANFGGHLKVGDTPGLRFGPGLLDPHGAEIHMIIRTHGQVVPELLSEQLTTFDAACPPNECVDLQASAHLPFTDELSMKIDALSAKIDTIARWLGIRPVQ